jgi:hypothetical protein
MTNNVLFDGANILKNWITTAMYANVNVLHSYFKTHHRTSFAILLLSVYGSENLNNKYCATYTQYLEK